MNHSTSTPSFVLAMLVAMGLCACARSTLVDAPDAQVLVFGSAEAQDFASLEVNEGSPTEMGNPAGDPSGFVSQAVESSN